MGELRDLRLRDETGDDHARAGWTARGMHAEAGRGVVAVEVGAVFGNWVRRRRGRHVRQKGDAMGVLTYGRERPPAGNHDDRHGSGDDATAYLAAAARKDVTEVRHRRLDE